MRLKGVKREYLSLREGRFIMAETQGIRKKRKPAEIEEEEERINAMKLEIAEELGLLEIIKEKGWAGLSAQECGRIGGKLVRRLKKLKARGEF